MLWKVAQKSHADFLFVQETHFSRISPTVIKHHRFPHIYLASFDKKKAWVMIAVRDTVLFQLIQSYTDPNGRYIILICNIDNVTCTIVNTYAPNSHQVSFLNNILKKVYKIRRRRLIWCGYFNGIGVKKLDPASKSICPPLQLQSWFTKVDLFDTWRCNHAAERDYTFYSRVHRSF